MPVTCRSPCRRTSAWSAPSSASTATTPTNVALQLAKQAGRPPREVAEPARGPARRGAGHQERRRRRSGLPQRRPRRRRSRRAGPDRSSRPGAQYGRTDAGAASASTSSSSRPTRPARCTSAAPGGPRSATASPGSSRPPARRWRASTTSTTTARRSTASPARCWPRAQGEPAPEDGYGGAYIDDIAAARGRGRAPGTSLDPARTTRRRRCSARAASS